MRLNRTENPIDRTERNKINENWGKIEADFNNVVNVISQEAFERVVDAAKLIWQTPVDAFSDISTTYPTPSEGWAVMTRDTGNVYRYSENDGWELIQEISVGPINALEDRLEDDVSQIEKEMASAIVTRQRPRNHNAFTSSVYNETHSKYVTVYRGGQTHVEATGAIFMTTSDDGETFSEPQKIIDNVLDCRDPSNYVLSDGTMLVNYFLYNTNYGEVYIAHIDIDGTVLSSNPLSGDNLEYCTSPIVEFNNELYLMTYSTNKLYLYKNANETPDGFSLIKTINVNSNLAASEPELFVSNGTLNAFVRSDANIMSPVYFITDVINSNSLSASDLIGKPSGYFDLGDSFLMGIRYLSPYVYYGEVKVYRVRKTDFSLIDEYLLDNSYDNDNAYVSFASKDNKELLVSYYTKLLNSGSVIKLVRTSTNQFKTKKLLVDAPHPLSSHEKPYVLDDNNANHPVLTLIQLNNAGQFVKLIDGVGDEIGVITKNAKNLVINTPNGNLNLNPNGKPIFFGNGAGEINTIGSWVIRGAIDSRASATFQNLRAYRIVGDVNSGALNVALRESGTTANRPTGSIPTAYQFFNVDLMQEQIYNGSTWITNMVDLYGNGSPQGVVSAGPSSIYRDKTNGNVYIKKTGVGNVGWERVNTSA